MGWGGGMAYLMLGTIYACERDAEVQIWLEIALHQKALLSNPEAMGKEKQRHSMVRILNLSTVSSLFEIFFSVFFMLCRRGLREERGKSIYFGSNPWSYSNFKN